MRTAIRKISIILSSAILLCMIVIVVLAWVVPLPHFKPYSLVVYDRHGEFLNAYLAGDDAWRMKTSPDDIPKRLKEIILHKEDKYFYYHPGFNPFALVRAFEQNILSGKRISGASTITMQVARMLEPKERTYSNKLIEIFRAVQLELHYSKAEILEMYLSFVPLGGNIEGLQSASMLYYRTPLQRLNISHLLDLILIPNNPNELRPDRNPSALLTKRLRLAMQLQRDGFLSREDSIVVAQTSAECSRKQFEPFAQHFTLQIKEKFGEKAEVVSSLDKQSQYIVERLLRNHLRPWRMLSCRNGAAMVIDNTTMEVIAYAGSDDFNDSLNFGQIDAVQAVRSPGSTLKPFLYALQMDKGTLTPKSRLLDVPYDVDGYSAENYEGTFSGWVFADDALRRSLNVPMIRLLKNAGVKPFVEALSSLNFRIIDQQQNKLGLSMIVGGCGVTLEELVSAYTVFPHEGKFFTPQFRKVDSTTNNTSTSLFTPASAFMVTEILSGINRPDLPNNFASAKNLPAVAFKTGTSYGRRDAWCVGYSADYTVGVWMGNVTNKGIPELVGSKSAAPLLIDIFNSLPHSSKKIILPQPPDIRTREVCAVSGNLPTQFCEHRLYDYYSVSKTLNTVCSIDKEYDVSPDGKTLYCPSCLGRNYKTIILQDYPPELLSFYRKIGQKTAKIPNHNPLCLRTVAGKGPVILSPSNGMKYLFTSPNQKLTLSATSSADVSEHTWYINNKFFAKKKTDEKIFLTLPGGSYCVTCMDNKGRLSSVSFTIYYL